MRGEEAGHFRKVAGVSIVDAGGSHFFNGRQLSGIITISTFHMFDCGMSLLLGGGGAYERVKNTSARVCAKNAGGANALRYM